MPDGTTDIIDQERSLKRESAPQEIQGLFAFASQLKSFVQAFDRRVSYRIGSGFSRQKIEELFGIDELRKMAVGQSQSDDTEPGWSRKIWERDEGNFRLHIKPANQEDFNDVMVRYRNVDGKEEISFDSGFVEHPFRRVDLVFPSQEDSYSFTVHLRRGDVLEGNLRKSNNPNGSPMWIVQPKLGKSS